MRRRRQKNPLLGRMIGVAVLINAVLLPILASLGVFHSKKETLMMTQLITLPKEVQAPAPPKPKLQHRTARPHMHLARREGQNAATHFVKPNPNAPKVEASTGPGSGSGPVIANNGNGKAGQVPVAPPVSAPPPTAPPAPVQTASKPAPPVTPPVAPQPPAAPVIVPAAAVSDPDPVVPDDLELDDNPPPLQALFSVHADGTATVTQLQSSGNPELDQVVMDTVKRWTFRPATKDGQPIDSYVRLTVDFTMS